MILAGPDVLLLCGPVAAVAAVWVAERIRVPYPVLLVGVGWLLSWLASPASPDISPDVVFYGFLPPLVYYAAISIAPDDLRVNARFIASLAVGLVAATAAAVAGVLVATAGVSFTVAVVAGAVVGPTNTVAATSAFRRLNAPRRLGAILEGEELANTGIALVFYQGVVGTIVAGAVHPAPLALTLLAGPAGGAALGLAIAWLLVQLRRRIQRPVLEITLSLATPYLTYAAADVAHLSGILAAVAAGIYTGSRLSRIYAPNVRLQEFAFHDVLVFLLNAVLFMLMGIQFDRKVHWAPGKPLAHLLAVMAAVVAVVIVVRMIWTLSGPAARRLVGRAVSKDVWRERVILGWSGMRGGVSLAAALAIPFHRADRSPLPDREVVVLVAGAVIVGSLLIQGVSLPWLLSGLGLKAEDREPEENKVRLKAAQAALAWLDDHRGGEGTDAAAESVRATYESARAAYEARAQRLKVSAPNGQAATDGRREQRYRELMLQLLSVERSVMLELRREGRIDATLLRTIERDFDLEEAWLRNSAP